MQFYTRWRRIASKEIADPVNKIRLIHMDRTQNRKISTLLPLLTHKVMNNPLFTSLTNCYLK
ncbi:hypothetical protein JCM19237_6784 [Photobacterium aphoticum]|uniref:Uncharacterized protein n=1 Tax=Photobacterium aphoticum TaxID=754436 RepID=A0A090RKM3_9GAMM|nr:hypothetical protein JCM19237_6784 [Photobacterium aphoticum]